MAHKKALGSAKKNKDSIAKRLGVKVYGEQIVKKGGIIIRQRGLKYRPGENVKTGKDYTLYSRIDGIVNFKNQKITGFTNTKRLVKLVSVANIK